MSNKRRAVIVAGIRTPFARAFGSFVKLDTIALGAKAVSGLIAKTELSKREIDALYWSGVVLPAITPNTGREIVLELKLPASIESFTVSRACSSSLLAITQAATTIERGEADTIIAGGSDSVSNTTVPVPAKLMQAFGPVLMGKKTGFADWLNAISQLMPLHEVIPQIPKVAERSTGQLMGESAEDMARRHQISRESQDEFALKSHLNAFKAQKSGRFDDEILPVRVTSSKTIYKDEIIRGDTTFEQLSALRPVFSKQGTLTAGNSSALTDGAAAVLLMSEEKAKALGYKPLAVVKGWHYCGVDPWDQLLIGPAYSMPSVLSQLKMQLSDIDIVDIHEAFAGQVLGVLKMLASKVFTEKNLPRDYLPSEIAPDKLNIHGGSIAIGHPFAATGARMVTTMARELQLTGKENALLGICAAGGLGAAAVLENI